MGIWTCKPMPQPLDSGVVIRERSNRDCLGKFAVDNADGRLVKHANTYREAMEIARKLEPVA